MRRATPFGLLLSSLLACGAPPGALPPSLVTASAPNADAPALAANAGDAPPGFSTPGWQWLPDEVHGSWLFVPAGLKGDAPLLVLLHGCGQTARDFATGTRAEALAAREHVVVLVPEQSDAVQPQRCWSWWAAQSANAPEVRRLLGAVTAAKGAVSIDEERVWVAGLSAGAAMAVNLGVTHPETFAAVGVHSGLEYGAAGDAAGALVAMQFGGPPAAKQAADAYAAMGPAAAPVALMVLQGTLDQTVNPLNGLQVFEQWRATLDLVDDGAANGSLPAPRHGWETLAGRLVEHESVHDDAGQSLVDLRLVAGLGHAWSGGATGGSFTEPGPDATQLFWEFFQGRRRVKAAVGRR